MGTRLSLPAVISLALVVDRFDKNMNWLEDHIENFVKPQIGADFDQQPLGYFAPEELTVIKNVWRSIKKNAKGRQILLPGRDVFVFEILARRENYPTIFMPECSRMTVKHIAAKIGPERNCFLFDTGFAGSIPRNLEIENFQLLSYNIRSTIDVRAVEVQVFPGLTWSRSIALHIEGSPKYWQSGRIDERDQVTQKLAEKEEFERAARLTIEVYKNSTPKFINQHRPIPTNVIRW